MQLKWPILNASKSFVNDLKFTSLDTYIPARKFLSKLINSGINGFTYSKYDIPIIM